MLEWRRQSADVRARAEAGRAWWEERRARERKEKEKQALLQGERPMQEIPRADTGVSASASAESPSISTSEWEAVSAGTTQQSASLLIPSPSTDASGGENAPSSHSHEGPPAQVTSFLTLPSFFVLMT